MTFEEIKKLESGTILISNSRIEREYIGFSSNGALITYCTENKMTYSWTREEYVKDWKLKEKEPELLWQWKILTDANKWVFEKDFFSEAEINKKWKFHVLKRIKHGKPIDANTGIEVDCE